MLHTFGFGRMEPLDLGGPGWAGRKLEQTSSCSLPGSQHLPELGGVHVLLEAHDLAVP